MDSSSIDDVFNAAKAARAQAQADLDAKLVAAAKSDASLVAYKAARDAFYLKAAEAFGEVAPTPTSTP